MSGQEPEVGTTETVKMLSPAAAGQLREFHLRWQFQQARCLLGNDDHGPQGLPEPIIPYAPFTRSRIYTGTRETGSYNHHSQLNQFRGRYVFAFSNGYVDAEAEGQRIMIS